MNNKTNIEEDMKYINLDLDILINNIRNLPEVTAIAIMVNKQPLLLKFQSILTDTYRLQAKANKYDGLVEKIKEIKAQSEKENKPYEEYDKESRMYWINEGKKSVCQELLDTEK